METTSKAESALVALLAAQTYPDYFNTDWIVPGESDEQLQEQLQLIRCVVGDIESEYPVGSGNFWVPVRVYLTTPFRVLPEGSEDTAPIDTHKAVAAILESAIMIDSLPADLTAAVEDFTCFGVLDRTPQREQGNDAWKSGYNFQLLVCGSSFS